MDELIRKALFKPYLKLNKQSSETQQDSWPECRSLLILHEGDSPTLAYFEAAFSRRPVSAGGYLNHTGYRSG